MSGEGLDLYPLFAGPLMFLKNLGTYTLCYGPFSSCKDIPLHKIPFIKPLLDFDHCLFSVSSHCTCEKIYTSGLKIYSSRPLWPH